MKALKKYSYMSPETEILSLEVDVHLLNFSNENTLDTGDPTNPDQSEYGAPWRF